ncbi:MAG: T9SS type A sorting domain-containing protein [Bacteroidota bacterium]|nr:T9SS type A sorting domain-containing protein [Bacteroidota bacterium]
MIKYLKLIFSVSFLFINNISFSQLVCISDINITVDITGFATLNVNQVVSSPLDADYVYLLSQTLFSCSDIGNPVTVVVEEQSLAGTVLNSCWFTVNVVRRLPDPCAQPTAHCLSEVNVVLNSDGEAIITPEMLVASLPLNPAYYYYSIPSSFDCSDIGPNTVTLYVVGAWGTNYCIMTVNVVERRPSPPICISIDLEDLTFLPEHIFDAPIIPEESIKFIASFNVDPLILKNAKPDFEFYFSSDRTIDSKDILLFSNSIPLKKKSSLTGSFAIPANIKTGIYYIIADMTIPKKQYNIGFAPVIQPIKIGSKPNQFDLAKSEIIAKDINTTELVLLNSVENALDFNILNNDVVLKKITLFDLSGKQLKTLSGDKSAFNFSFLTPGIYLLEIIDINDNRSVHKIFKQ